MNIRRAGLADAEILSDLGRKTFVETYARIYESLDTVPEGMAEDYAQANFNLDQIKRELKDSGNIFLLAERNTEPIGYAKLESGKPPETVDDPEVVELSRIYLSRAYHRMGLGKKLLEQAIIEAQKIPASGIWLGVWDHNIQAIGFYLKMGFRKAGTQVWRFKHKGYDYADTDLVLLKKF